MSTTQQPTSQHPMTEDIYHALKKQTLDIGIWTCSHTLIIDFYSLYSTKFHMLITKIQPIFQL